MILLPDTVVAILLRGGSLRIPARGLFPQTMVQYAAAAKQGKARLEFVIGETVLFPQTMYDVAAAGGGMVSFDLVSAVSD